MLLMLLDPSKCQSHLISLLVNKKKNFSIQFPRAKTRPLYTASACEYRGYILLLAGVGEVSSLTVTICQK